MTMTNTHSILHSTCATVLIVLTPSSLLTLQVEPSGRRIEEFDHSVDSVVRTTRWVCSFVCSFDLLLLFLWLHVSNAFILLLYYYTTGWRRRYVEASGQRIEAEFDHSVDSVVRTENNRVSSFVHSFDLLLMFLLLLSHVSNASILLLYYYTTGWRRQYDPVQESHTS